MTTRHLAVRYHCCRHCFWAGGHPWLPINAHAAPCSMGCNDGHGPDPYVEEANANPERRNNGCQIYRVGSNG
jgi:hypothetical protein